MLHSMWLKERIGYEGVLLMFGVETHKIIFFQFFQTNLTYIIWNGTNKLNPNPVVPIPGMSHQREETCPDQSSIDLLRMISPLSESYPLYSDKVQHNLSRETILNPRY